jgi:hypothetical protein
MKHNKKAIKQLAASIRRHLAGFELTPENVEHACRAAISKLGLTGIGVQCADSNNEGDRCELWDVSGNGYQGSHPLVTVDMATGTVRS